MKIDLSSIDRENFLVHEHVISGETCYLVQPTYIGSRWSIDTLHFRSSLWNSNGELISASFKKFFNWSEQPDLVSVPTDLSDAQLMEKLDGSTLIMSKYKGELILRTRGTVDATKLDNGDEIEFLKKKYPKVFSFFDVCETGNVSYVFEWVSPKNKIVLDYGPEADIYLTAAIGHDDYSMFSQYELDVISELMEVKRPKVFNYSSTDEMLKSIDVLQGQEGICVYFNNGQDIRKVKSAQYLALHRFKSNATLDNTVELFFGLNKPEYSEFEKQLIEKFDHECFEMVKVYASQICSAFKEVEKIMDGFKSFAETVRGLSRKDAASLILKEYSKDARTSYVFNIIDGKVIDDEKLKKLLYQVLQK